MRSQGGGNVRGCEGGFLSTCRLSSLLGFSCFYLTLKHAKNSICKFLRPRKSEHTAMSGYWQLGRYFLVGKSTITLTFSFTWPQQKTCWWRASWTLFRAINLHWLNSADGICPRPMRRANAASCDSLPSLDSSSVCLYFAQLPKTITPPKASVATPAAREQQLFGVWSVYGH